MYYFIDRFRTFTALKGYEKDIRGCNLFVIMLLSRLRKIMIVGNNGIKCFSVQVDKRIIEDYN